MTCFTIKVLGHQSKPRCVVKEPLLQSVTLYPQVWSQTRRHTRTQTDRVGLGYVSADFLHRIPATSYVAPWLIGPGMSSREGEAPPTCSARSYRRTGNSGFVNVLIHLHTSREPEDQNLTDLVCLGGKFSSMVKT